MVRCNEARVRIKPGETASMVGGGGLQLIRLVLTDEGPLAQEDGSTIKQPEVICTMRPEEARRRAIELFQAAERAERASTPPFDQGKGRAATTVPRSGRITTEAAVVQDMATRVISNGGEPAYAMEKLWRALQATIRALIHDLDTDPHQLIEAIERETQ